MKRVLMKPASVKAIRELLEELCGGLLGEF